MKRYRVRPARRLRGSVRVPGDKSIGHRALLFGALADGECTIRGLSDGLDNSATAAALRAMGVGIEVGADAARVRGVGLTGLSMAPGPIDCANSGTTMRLLAGLLSAQHFGSRLVGDASLSRRPMRRIVEPLRARGAHIAGSAPEGSEELYPPLSIAPLVPGEQLVGLEYEMPKPSAQVKSAVLLSGLYADGMTALREPMLSRDHTERMMLALGVPLETLGAMVVLDPESWEQRGWDPFDWTLPGDPSSAAFPLAAALTVDGSDVTVEAVGTNPTRTGMLEVLRLMGAQVGVVPKGEVASDEPLADLLAASGGLRGRLVGGEVLLRMIDEVPALCAVAAAAMGTTEIRDAAELRVKESDRLTTMAQVLDAFGVPVTELEDGLRIEGGRPLRAAHVRSHGDHRVAMAAVVLGLRAGGETLVDDVACVETSFPGFAELLRGLGADIVEENAPEEDSP